MGCDGGALDDVFGDGMFVRYCECIGGAVTVWLQRGNAMVYCGTKRSGMWRGQKWCMNGCREI